MSEPRTKRLNISKQVWETFNAIDTKPLTKQNNKVDYISWSKVWRVIMDTYPNSAYSFSDRDIHSLGENGPCITVEVSCTLIIRDDDDGVATKSMHLPVMQSYGQFKAIEGPTARDISDAKMRCLVKCAAMHGLGLNIWSGDDSFEAKERDPHAGTIAFAKIKSSIRMDLWKTAIVIKEAYEAEDDTTALEAWSECSEEEMRSLWQAESKGGFFTTKEREWIRKLRITTEE